MDWVAFQPKKMQLQLKLREGITPYVDIPFTIKQQIMSVKLMRVAINSAKMGNEISQSMDRVTQIAWLSF